MAVYNSIINGLTVRLRAIEERDAEITYKWRTDPEKTKYVHVSTGSVEDQLRFIQRQRTLPGDYLFIIENLDGVPIGMKGIYNYNPEQKTVESGRFIGYGNQIQNIEALYLGFDFAFDYLNVEKVIMSALESNEGMLSIQKSLGVKEFKRDYLKDFGCDNIYSELSKEQYIAVKLGIEKLIRRFAER